MTVASSFVRPGRTDSIFFPAMALAMAATVFVGFAPSYYMKSVFNAPPALSPLMAVHGAAFTAWIGLLVAQTGLIAGNRRDIHRKLGVAGAVLAAVLVVLGTMLALDALRRGFTPPGGPPPTVFFAIPIGSMVAFPVMVALGVANRKRLDYHKRYMLLATVAILGAAIARIRFDFILTGPPMVFMGLSDLFILAMAAYDFTTRGRVHPATLWSAAVLIVLSQVLPLAIAFTPAWTAFANSLI